MFVEGRCQKRLAKAAMSPWRNNIQYRKCKTWQSSPWGISAEDFAFYSFLSNTKHKRPPVELAKPNSMGQLLWVRPNYHQQYCAAKMNCSMPNKRKQKGSHMLFTSFSVNSFLNARGSHNHGFCICCDNSSSVYNFDLIISSVSFWIAQQTIILKNEKCISTILPGKAAKNKKYSGKSTIMEMDYQSQKD